MALGRRKYTASGTWKCNHQAARRMDDRDREPCWKTRLSHCPVVYHLLTATVTLLLYIWAITSGLLEAALRVLKQVRDGNRLKTGEGGCGSVCSTTFARTDGLLAFVEFEHCNKDIDGAQVAYCGELLLFCPRSSSPSLSRPCSSSTSLCPPTRALSLLFPACRLPRTGRFMDRTFRAAGQWR